MPLRLKTAGITDVGCERDHNEDSYRLIDEKRLYVVADGMGGHRAGDVASELACKTLEEFFTASEDEDITWPFQFDPRAPLAENRIVTGIRMANKRIFQASHSHSDQYGMGTTVVGIVFEKNFRRAVIAHVGDSRCYRLSDGNIELITSDHSLVNDYRKAMPGITDEQLGDLPRNVITRALGMQDDVIVDTRIVETKPGDLFLLCSDGLNSMITDEVILESTSSFGSEELKPLAQKLINEAKDAGGEDNVTVIAVLVTGTLDEDEDIDSDSHVDPEDETVTAEAVRSTEAESLDSIETRITDPREPNDATGTEDTLVSESIDEVHKTESDDENPDDGGEPGDNSE